MDLFGGASGFTHGPLGWSAEEIFADSRNFGDPSRSRFIKLQNATPDGGAFSFSKAHGKTVIVGRETLRLMAVGDDKTTGLNDGDLLEASNAKPTSFSVGPGGSRAEIGPNFWSGKFRAVHQMTDVTWGPEGFSDKVFTSCSTGEVMVWDFGKGGLKWDTSLTGSARSVNVVTAATHSAHNIATGSNDGSVKLWDLRHPRNPAFNLLSHGSAVRSLTFGQTSTLPVHVVLGLESGIIFRYDLRMRIEYLDRLVAHTACVHDLAWLPPTKDDTCAGYLASGSFDHTVKIWQIEQTRISLKPLHTLHAGYPIGKIGWRPSFETEIVVLPYHSGASGKPSSSKSTTVSEASERFAPQIWDVRNGWLAKWSMPPIDGPATDMYVMDPYSVHMLYKSGSFVQHDLHNTSRPYDLIQRQALSWSANSNLFFVADKPQPFDPPYDDLHPSFAPMLSDYGMLDKQPGDRLSIMTTQVLGTEHIPSGLNRESYMKLARGYNHHDEDRVQMCKTNEEVATYAGQHEVAQTWALLGSLLTEYVPPKKPQQPIFEPAVVIFQSGGTTSTREPQSATKLMPKSPPLSAHVQPDDPPSNFSLDGLGQSGVKRKGSGGAAMLAMHLAQNQKRRDSSPSLLSATRPGGAATRSPSSSPASKPMKLPPTTMSMSYNPSSMVRPHIPRRVSISSAGNSHSHSPVTKGDAKAGWGAHSLVADGALSGSSDEESGEADDAVVQSEASVSSSWSKEKRKVTRLGLQHPTLHSSSSSTSPSPALGGNRPLPPSHLIGTKAALLSNTNSRLSSPQLQLLNIQDVHEEDPDEEEGLSDEEEDAVSLSSASIRMKQRSSDEEDHAHDPTDVPLDPHALAKQSPPSPTLAKYAAKSHDSSRTTTIGRSGTGLKILTKQDSGESLTTAYQMGSVGYVGSFGSTMMTPTMGRMGIGSSIKQVEGEITSGYSGATDGWAKGSSKQDMTMRMPGSAASTDQRRDNTSSGLPKSLSDLFSTPSAPPSASTIPTPSTNAPSSATRSTIPRNSSFGSRANKTHGTLMSMSSINPPESGGYEKDSISHNLNQPGDEDKSMWKGEYEDVVRTLEEGERKEMWSVLKECLDQYSEEGNIQMCAAMAMAAHEELDLSPERLERFIVGYLDQLMQMRLHLNAAYVRHVSPVASLRDSATSDSFNYITCGTCGKIIEASGPPEAVGRYAYCERCRLASSRCSICHLPARRMLLFCHGCGHGGHQNCYQEFYAQQPPVDFSNPQSKFPHSRTEDMHVDYEEANHGEVDSSHIDDMRWIPVGGERMQISDALRGRRNARKVASEGVDTPDSIPEKEPISFTASNNASNVASRALPHGHPHAMPGNDRRSSSRAETSTIVEEDRGLPDEEYIIVREKEAADREAERLNMRLLGHLCAAGCGHICWMTRDE